MARITFKEAAKLIGRKGCYDVGGMQVQVEILDIRTSFGRTDAQVRPMSGAGTGWISLEKIKFA